MKITEKSDVYSFGIVVLEVLTGKQPIDPTIPDGQHVVDWVRQKKGVGVLDSALLSRPESEIEEMMQVLGIALLCVNFSPDERPNMKDVAAMLKEIKHETDSKIDVFVEGGVMVKKIREQRGCWQWQQLHPPLINWEWNVFVLKVMVSTFLLPHCFTHLPLLPKWESSELKNCII